LIIPLIPRFNLSKIIKFRSYKMLV
jgi:hypothetical protein